LHRLAAIHGFASIGDSDVFRISTFGFRIFFE